MLATKDGKLVRTSDGKLSQCCCGCSVIDFDQPDPEDPDFTCVQYIEFRFNIDQSEEDAGGQSGDFVDFGDANFGFYADYDARNWVGYGGDLVTLPMGPDSIAGIWHTAQLILLSDGANRKTKFCVDGVVSAATPAHPTSIALIDRIVAGSNFPAGGSISHRSISGIKLISNSRDFLPGGVVLAFPPTVFDTTSGSGISFTDGILRVDNDSSDTVIATTFGGDLCACFRPGVARENLSYFNSITLSGTLSGTLNVVAGSGCDGLKLTVNASISQTWTRVDRTLDLFGLAYDPGPGQFQIYVDSSGIERLDVGGPNACEACFLASKDIAASSEYTCELPDCDPEDIDCLENPPPNPWTTPAFPFGGQFSLEFCFLSDPSSPPYFAFTGFSFAECIDAPSCDIQFNDFTIGDFDEFHHLALSALPGTYHYSASGTPTRGGPTPDFTGLLNYDATFTIS